MCVCVCVWTKVFEWKTPCRHILFHLHVKTRIVHLWFLVFGFLNRIDISAFKHAHFFRKNCFHYEAVTFLKSQSLKSSHLSWSLPFIFIIRFPFLTRNIKVLKTPFHLLPISPFDLYAPFHYPVCRFSMNWHWCVSFFYHAILNVYVLNALCSLLYQSNLPSIICYSLLIPWYC